MEPAKNSICRSCRLRLTGNTKARSFSTSTVRRVVPPESPYYVDIPTSFQPYLPYAKQQKGTLPVPRELFPASRPDKPSKEYLENATKDPLEKNLQKRSEIGRYKSKMAEARRLQLREGLTNLYARKQAETNTMGQQSLAKQRQRAQLLQQPEREDARLTSISVPSELSSNSQTSIAALEADLAVAQQIHKTKLANLERAEISKQESKMDALHTLYMNARTFVTTEDQLNKLITDQFDTESPRFEGEGKTVKHADFMTDQKAGQSMWNFGPPTSVKDMIRSATGQAQEVTMRDAMAQTRLRGEHKGEAQAIAREQERMKKIAEKLSGGKI